MAGAGGLMKELKDRRQKIIITCEPEDIKLIEDALGKIEFGKSQGTIQIEYDPSLSVKEN